MLAIKLSPVGKKKQISYRIVINEKRSKLNGKCVEDVGWYNPHTNKFSIKAERVKYWLASGAQPTDSVHNILVTAKLIEGAKIPLHKKSKQEPKAPTETQSATNEQGSSATEVKAEEKSENSTNVAENSVEAPEEKIEEKQETSSNTEVAADEKELTVKAEESPEKSITE